MLKGRKIYFGLWGSEVSVRDHWFHYCKLKGRHGDSGSMEELLRFW